jgi:hypothetical protein
MKKLRLSERDLDKIVATMVVFRGLKMHNKISKLTGVDAEKIDSVRREGSFTHTW